MELEIKIWCKYISGFGRWKNRKLMVQSDIILILKQKNGQLLQKLNVRDIKIKKDEQTPRALKLFTGIKKIYIKFKDVKEAEQFRDAVEKQKGENKGDHKNLAVYTILKNYEDYNLNLQEQVSFLLSDQKPKQIDEKMGLLCDKVARFKESYSDLSDYCQNVKYLKQWENLSKIAVVMRNVIYELQKTMVEQQNNLIVVQEILKKQVEVASNEKQNFEQDILKMFSTKTKDLSKKEDLDNPPEENSDESQFFSF